jgi:phenylpropionate dioxygenase-like ring-hydroxylating dioxygenase large terminal subunit
MSNRKELLEFPKLNYEELTPQDKYDLQWYVVGESSEFIRNIPQKVRVWNTNYVIWRTTNNTFVGLSDACTHKGASLSCGYVQNNHIVCPYHGYEFDTNGTLDKVPGLNFTPSTFYNLEKYNVVEKNGWVYLNILKINSTTPEYDTNIYIEPEVFQNLSCVQLNMNYECYSRILSENSLDVMHIAFVHTFGNAKRPSPHKEDPPKMVGRHHYMTTYYYEAGEDSVARKVFGIKDLK